MERRPGRRPKSSASSRSGRESPRPPRGAKRTAPAGEKKEKRKGILPGKTAPSSRREAAAEQAPKAAASARKEKTSATERKRAAASSRKAVSRTRGPDRGPAYGWMRLCLRGLRLSRRVTGPLGRALLYLLLPSLAGAGLLYGIAYLAAERSAWWGEVFGTFSTGQALLGAWAIAALLAAFSMARVRILAGWFLAGYVGLLALREALMLLGVLGAAVGWRGATWWERLLFGEAGAYTVAGELHFFLLYVPLGLLAAALLAFFLRSPLEPTLSRRVLDRGERAGEAVRCLGPFEVSRRSHLGALGPTYLAKRLEDGAPVDLVALTYEGPGEGACVARFEEGCRRLEALEHPRLLGLTSWGRTEEEGILYRATRRVEGARPLAEAVRKAGGRLEPAAALRIAADLAGVLAVLHHAGTTYDQLRLDTVLVDADGHAYLRPEPIVEPPAAALRWRRVAGTPVEEPFYLSPEQVLHGEGEEGPAPDGRSDQWALGALLYRLLTGERPFEAWSAARSMDLRLSGALPHFRDLRVDVPDGFVRVLRRMLARSPAERYPDAGALEEDLRRLEKGEAPAQAALPAASASSLAAATDELPAAEKQRLARTIRPSLWPVLGLATALLILLGGAAGGVVYWATRPDPEALARRAAIQQQARKLLAKQTQVTNNPGAERLYAIELVVAAGEGPIVFEEAARAAREATKIPELRSEHYDRYRQLFQVMADVYGGAFQPARSAEGQVELIDKTFLGGGQLSLDRALLAVANLHRALAPTYFPPPTRGPILRKLAQLLHVIDFEEEALVYGDRAVQEALQNEDWPTYCEAGIQQIKFLLAASRFGEAASLGKDVFRRARQIESAAFAGDAAYNTALAYHAQGDQRAAMLEWYEQAATHGEGETQKKARLRLKQFTGGRRAVWEQKARFPEFEMERARKYTDPRVRIQAFSAVLEHWADTDREKAGGVLWEKAMDACGVANYEIGKAHLDLADAAASEAKRREHIEKAREHFRRTIEKYYPYAGRYCAEAQLRLAQIYLDVSPEDPQERLAQQKKAVLAFRKVVVGYPLEKNLASVAEFKLERLLAENPALQTYYEKEILPMPEEELMPEEPELPDEGEG